MKGDDVVLSRVTLCHICNNGHNYTKVQSEFGSSNYRVRVV